ncbi:murein L,D-transpeptidase catalytic domain-containing protein [Microbulbifer sp. JSM ZJ756]|uniref:murein L,D-transpeptidase catalytic domain-containing protein n=1 Tax=Microbulbifer sp. JSM ZJ756 TaxID=3376191 RepID=UPI00378BD862
MTIFSKNNAGLLQLALKAMDLYEGKIDGIVGPLTLTAIQKVEALAFDRPAVEKPEPEEPAEKTDEVEDIIEDQGASIEHALVFTLKNEGGYVDHPADRGGATNKGITIGTLSAYLGRDVSKAEVKNLSYETIRDIYKRNYWDVLNLDHVVDQSIATALFDMGVLCGTGTAARLCQDVLDIPESKKMDAGTLKAINRVADDEFIPAFIDRNIRRFEAIVKKRPSQRVFLRGWKNRANRLRTLIETDSVDERSPESVPDEPIGDGLYTLADQVGVPRDDISKMINWQSKHHPTSNPRYWAIFKIREHSRNKRLYVFDRVARKVERFHVTHGKGSDPNHDGIATEFSNRPDSHMSSLGLCRTLNEYRGRYGKSLRLEGLEPSNNNVFKRAIVFHGTHYAGDDWVRRHGRCGRSWGCPAVEHAVAPGLVDKLKNGSLLLVC